MTLTIIALLSLIMSCAAVVLALVIRKDLQKADAQQSVYAEELQQELKDMSEQSRQQYTDLMGEFSGYKAHVEARSGDWEPGSDELYDSAKEAVIAAGKASTSYLQRKLGVGYSRAMNLMDLLEDEGVIGPANGAQPREVVGE